MINVGTANDTFEQIWHGPKAPAFRLEIWVHLFEGITSKRIKKSVTSKFLIGIAGLFIPFINELYERAYQVKYPYLVNHNK